MRAARSVLAVPASNQRMIDKGLASAADMVFLDLEDSVAPAEKGAARARAIAAMNDGDWAGKPRVVRINAVDTPWFARDVVDLLEQAGERLDLIVLPKCEGAADLLALDRLLASLERGVARTVPVGVDAQIESARGVVGCEAIAVAAARLEALVFGPGDFAATMRMPARAIGMTDAWDAAYGGDRYHYAQMRMVTAARGAGVRAIDGPYADYKDAEGLRRAAMRARAMGHDGKWCIHPGQIAVVNEVFTPDAAEIAAAQDLVAAYAAAMAAGTGAATHDGVMIDMASVRMAEATLAVAQAAAHNA
jgi:citrate lyase beta subunit